MPLESSELISLSRLLDAALELDPSRWTSWLEALPDAVRHLEPRLRDMLDEHAQTSGSGFLSSGPRLDDAAGPQDPDAGSLVGPYRLIREIGRGGMGLVWLAERSDGALKRQVALKLPRLVWGAGLAERMARERDIVALLEHPNIARLYDAGIDALGRPYLAFEYIDGQAIDEWCSAHSLGVRPRLGLFLQVARAVAYAHGRLVVHRDLKPSNVLVTQDGQTHLLDFGIAKLLDEAPDLDASLTRDQGRVLTPRYASPEQLRGETITVASDVYSLGVLLFELLTGRVPAKPADQPAHEAPRASRVARDPIMATTLRGDLDAILAKALEQEPARRYATASALADDIQRHLDGEPVLAQPDSTLYRLLKAVQRHRLPFALAGTALAAVVVGATVAIVQAQHAREAAERARVVKEFVLDVFRVNERGNPANAELRQLPTELMLDRGAGRIATRFAGDPGLQAELYGVVAGIFADMSRHERAEEYARKQFEALEAIAAPREERARALTSLSAALTARNRLTEAEKVARQAVGLASGSPADEAAARLALVDALTPQSRDVEVMAELDRVEADLAASGRASSLQGVDAQAKRAFMLSFTDFDRGAALYEQAIARAIQIEGPLSRLAIQSRFVLARGYASHLQVERARQHTAALLTALRARGGVDEISAALVEIQLTVHMALRDFKGRTLTPMPEALATVEARMAELQALQPPVAPAIAARAAFNLGVLNQNWGNMVRAHELVLPAAEVMRTAWADNPWIEQLTNGAMGVAEMFVGRHARADTLLRESIRWSRRAGRESDSFTFIHLARNLLMQRRHGEAHSELGRVTRALDGPEASRMPSRDQILITRAELELDKGDAASALQLVPPDGPDDDDYIYWDRRLVRGAALCALGRADEGLALIEGRLIVAAEEHYAHDPQLARWRAIAGSCALRAGNRTRALELFRLSRQAFVEQPGVSPYFSAPQVLLARQLGQTPAGLR